MLLMANNNTTILPLFQGDGKDSMEPARWFAMFQLGLPSSWTDTKKIEYFQLQLDPGSVAEEWFYNLSDNKMATLNIL